MGHCIELFFLSLPYADVAVQRVAERVQQRRRDIPETTMHRRRYEAGRRLLIEVYQPLVDQWVVYNNAGEEPVLMDWSEKP